MADVDKLVRTFVKMRDKKAELNAAHDAQIASLDEQMDIIKDAISEAIKETGGTAIKTQYGTATRVIRRKFWTADKEAFINFALENDARGLLDVRVAQKNTGEWIDEHEGEIPNGINVEQRYDVQVRRA